MKTPTVAILTISDDGNYGNRLQNYALSDVLSRFFDVSTIRMFLRTNSHCKYRALRLALPFFSYRKILQGLPSGGFTGRLKRVRRFAAFSKLIPTGSYYLSSATGFDSRPAAPYPAKVVIGSDQVWNYTWLTKEELRLRLGYAFEPDGLVAYAASIGVDTIDEEARPIFEKGLNRIKHVSVREDKAAELVRELTGREPAVVLDPTLLLTAQRWSELFTGFAPDEGRYVVTYFLGHPTAAQESVIQNVSHALNARVCRLNDGRDRVAISAGPSEFVELLAKASFVFTDSYHACCFSILNNVPFKVFNRQGYSGEANMNSRMRTLFRLFELDDLMRDDSSLSEFDWPRINQLLERYRAESMAWLKHALGSLGQSGEGAVPRV